MADAGYRTLRCTVEEGVATLTLHRPEARNALSAEMADELGALIPAIRLDAAVRALVVTGAGGAFCAGGDVRAMDGSGARTAAEVRAGMERYRRLTVELIGLDKPVVAAVDGVAYGAGFSIALMADIVIVSDRARFSMVFQRLGLIPDCGAMYTLPRAVGLQRAKELVFSARVVGPDEAVRIGIATEVTRPDDLLPRAQTIARSFCGASSAALSIGKRALDASLQSDLATVLDIEAAGQAVSASSDYLREAARRFVAKEPAQFSWPAGGASGPG